LAHAASLCNATAATATARHPTTRSLCTSIYGLILGASGLDFLDSGVFFIVLFQNCLQSSFLCRLGLRITAAVSLLQWAFFMVWPFIFVDLNPVWMCRIIGPGLWAAQQIRASYVWECELKQQAQRIDDLQWTLAKTRLQYLLLQQDKNQVKEDAHQRWQSSQQVTPRVTFLGNKRRQQANKGMPFAFAST
jgi:hypothetical protein